MKRSFLMSLLGATAMVSMAIGFAGQGNAALVSCPGSFTTDGTAKVNNGSGAKLTAASGCQYLTPADNSNVATIANINTAGFFGFSDWMSNGQTQINSNQSSGTWSISNVDFASSDYIIVFKDGANTNLTAFLFNEDYASGKWSTPFTDPPFNLPGKSTSHDVSHYTIAKRAAGTPPPPTDVPEPASLAIFGVGLLGLGYAARRRKHGV
jgi:PEP-CTERM motif